MIKLLLHVAAVSCALADHQHHGQTDYSKTAAPVKPGPPSEPPVTHPDGPGPSGPFRGSWMTSRLGRKFQSYRGIRYAYAPRFQPPDDVLVYPSEVDASKDGPACPLPVAPGEYYVDEDCLRLNVYTPDNRRSRKLPVIFFIHPGGFYSMTGRSDLFGPDYLLDRDIVLVTMNYRLASLEHGGDPPDFTDHNFNYNISDVSEPEVNKWHENTADSKGFLSTGDAVAPGNNGYKDQVSALRWVARNIAAFGGDPQKVTIAGDSAGSISVMLHMISDMSKGLFHQGIAMSASPMGKEPLPTHQFELAQKQAKILNCPTNTSQEIVDCLKTKSWQDIGNSLVGFFDEERFDRIGLWTPVVEPDLGHERFLAVQPAEAVRKGRMRSMPMLISQTEDEFFWKAFRITRNKTLLDRMNAEWETLAPNSFDLPKKNARVASRRLKEAYLDGKPLENTPEINKKLGKLYGDSWIGLNTHRMANLMCRHSLKKVWYSLFSYIGNNSFYEDPLTGKPAGAAHHDDLIYLFSMSYFRKPIGARSPPPPAPQDHVMVERMTAIWYNFAKHGDPNPCGGELPELSSMHWPAMKATDRKYLKVDKEFSVHEKMHEKQLRVWDELYPMEF